jgi:hypothetical protein
MDPLETIRQKAEVHARRYRSFDMPAFLRWIASKPVSWQCDAASKTIANLNIQRRYQSWETQQASRRIKYTGTPPEDGPA